MALRPLDTDTLFQTSPQLPDTRMIEKANVREVAPENPERESVAREPYLVTPELAEAVNLAIALGRPLLLQGDPGCGKTMLARAVAYTLGLPLEESYIKSTTRARDLLYNYDAVSRLYESQLNVAQSGEDGRGPSLDPVRYIRLGPFGRAIVRARYGRRSVVLIDEIDKADLDFPNDLLRELDELRFTITETGETHAVPPNPGLRPIVFVTHNEEKPLPPAFLRRCIYHELTFPRDRTLLAEVLAAHDAASPKLATAAVEVLMEMWGRDLTRKPGISELLDWARILEARDTDPTTLETQLPAIDALIKSPLDQRVVRDHLAQGGGRTGVA